MILCGRLHQENLARIARYGVSGLGDGVRMGGQLSSVYGLQAPMAGVGAIGSKYGAANIKRCREKFTLYYVYYISTQISSGSIAKILGLPCFCPTQNSKPCSKKFQSLRVGWEIRVQVEKSLAFCGKKRREGYGI